MKMLREWIVSPGGPEATAAECAYLVHTKLTDRPCGVLRSDRGEIIIFHNWGDEDSPTREREVIERLAAAGVSVVSRREWEGRSTALVLSPGATEALAFEALGGWYSEEEEARTGGG